jgi:tetratricopeptide (TPR) repeat protein
MSKQPGRALRVLTSLLTFLSISEGAPHDSKFLERERTVQALLQRGSVAEAQSAFRSLQYEPEYAAKIGVLADLLGVALLDQQRYREAESVLTFSIATLEPIAPADPKIARVLGHLAEARWAEGRLAEAQALSERALRLQSRASDVNPEILTTLQNLAAIHRERGQYSLSTKYLTKAIDAVPIQEPTRDLWRAMVLQDSAALHLQSGNLKAAKAASLRALAIVECAKVSDPSLLVSICTSVGLVEARLKHHARAQVWIDRAANVADSNFGLDDVRYGATLLSRATVEEALGLYKLAEESLNTAAAIQAAKLGRTSPAAARTLLRQSAVFSKLGRHSEAVSADNAARLLLADESSSEMEVSLAQLKTEAISGRPR